MSSEREVGPQTAVRPPRIDADGRSSRALRRLSKSARQASLVAMFAILAGWFLFLRPQSLGGPAGYVLVEGVSMEPTLHAGSLAVVQRQPDYRDGDVVAYRVEDDIARGNLVIHRIVGGEGASGYVMMGDAVAWTDPWHPTSAQVLGKVVFVIPGVAPLLLFLRAPLVVASVAAGITVYLVLGWPTDRPRGPFGRDVTKAG